MTKEDMKKGAIILTSLLFIVFGLTSVLAEACNLQISLINQDPYPAIQGEEATIVFQIDGVQNKECGTVEFGLIQSYPITISPGEKTSYSFESGTFQKNFQSFFLAPFKVRLSEDAIDGNNIIEVRYKQGKNTVYEVRDFNLNIFDSRADFEVYVKDYDTLTKIITFEILNIAESDVSALTIEIPKQNNIEIKGSNRNIEGDLDSNDYVTSDFEAIPKEGDLKLIISYTDQINERRVLEKMVHYDPSYFELGEDEKPSTPASTYIIVLVIFGLIIWFFVRRSKKKAAKRRK